MKKLLLVIVAVFILAGCTFVPPEITYYNVDTIIVENLSENEGVEIAMWYVEAGKKLTRKDHSSIRMDFIIDSKVKFPYKIDLILLGVSKTPSENISYSLDAIFQNNILTVTVKNNN